MTPSDPPRSAARPPPAAPAGAGIARRAAGALRRRVRAAATAFRIRRNTRHLLGPGKIRLDDDQCVVVALIRDADYFLAPFLAHHRALGAAHFLLIDNGSRDETLAEAARHADVTVMANPLPVRQYECRLRAQIARRVVRGGWFLFLDADEMFVPPQGEGGQLGTLTRYCNRHGYTAMVCQMLDMVSPEPLSATRAMPYHAALEAFDRYNLEGVRQRPYFDPEIEFAWHLARNRCESADVAFLFGGIRAQVFGENCCLTKHSLVKNADGIDLYVHAHCSANVDCADVTALIRHYKICGDYLGREGEQVARGAWGHGEDARRLRFLENRQDSVIAAPGMAIYDGPERLRAQEFLAASARFMAEAAPSGDTARKC